MLFRGLESFHWVNVTVSELMISTVDSEFTSTCMGKETLIFVFDVCHADLMTNWGIPPTLWTTGTCRKVESARLERNIKSVSFYKATLVCLFCNKTKGKRWWQVPVNKAHIINFCGRARARPQTNLSVVSGTRADLKQNVGTFLAFLCSSNGNEWYVNKRRSKGPGVEFKFRGMGHVFHVN